jgi:hypothetical protein
MQRTKKSRVVESRDEDLWECWSGLESSVEKEVDVCWVLGETNESNQS